MASSECLLVAGLGACCGPSSCCRPSRAGLDACMLPLDLAWDRKGLIDVGLILKPFLVGLIWKSACN